MTLEHVEILGPTGPDNVSGYDRELTPEQEALRASVAAASDLEAQRDQVRLEALQRLRERAAGGLGPFGAPMLRDLLTVLGLNE